MVFLYFKEIILIYFNFLIQFTGGMILLGQLTYVLDLINI